MLIPKDTKFQIQHPDTGEWSDIGTITNDVNISESLDYCDCETIHPLTNFSQTFTISGKLTYLNRKALRRMFKLPRKLKKRLYGTRRSRKRQVINCFRDAVKRYDEFMKKLNDNGVV